MWDYEDHPAIADLPLRTRQRLLAGARRRLLARHRVWLIGGAVWVALLAMAVLLHLNGWRGSRVAFWCAMAVLAIDAAGLCVAAVRSRKQFPLALQRELMARQIWPLACLFCGYTLRGVRSDRCPECGAALSARAAEPQEG